MLKCLTEMLICRRLSNSTAYRVFYRQSILKLIRQLLCPERAAISSPMSCEAIFLCCCHLLYRECIIYRKYCNAI